MAGKKATNTKQAPVSPPYDYVQAISTYIESRKASGLENDAASLPSLTSSSTPPSLGDRAALRAGLDALQLLVECNCDVEGGAVLPPLVAGVASRDQALVDTPSPQFASRTLDVYDGSLFLMLEGAMASPLPGDGPSVAVALAELKSGEPAPSGKPASRLSLLVRAFRKLFTGDQPLWLAYADSCVPDSNWEGVSGLQNLAKRLRLTLLEVKDLAPEAVPEGEMYVCSLL